jgi:hypothetical protein
VSYPTEPKVKAAATAGTVAAGSAPIVIAQIIDDLFLDGPGPDAVPPLYLGLISAVLVAVSSWYAGWSAPHVDRPSEEIP